MHSLLTIHVRKHWILLVVCCCLVLQSGCQWMRWNRDRYTGAVPPVVLPKSSPLDQLLTTVNNNTARVRSLISTNATLRADGAPVDLKADLAVEPRRNFRLKAKSLLGDELDVGSNSNDFWLWIRRNQPPAMYVGRHDQFANSQARQIFPVEPDWLIEAMGLVTFNPQQQIQGPIPRGPDQVEVRQTRGSGGQSLQQITRIDSTRGVVTEQHLYTPSGERIASSLTSEHRVDMQSGAVLPRKIVLEWPAAKMKLTLDLWDLQVNTLGPEQAALWQRPTYKDFPEVDLAQAGLMFGPAPTGGNMLLTQPPGTSAPPIMTGPGSMSPGAVPGQPNQFQPGQFPPNQLQPNPVQPFGVQPNVVPGSPLPQAANPQPIMVQPASYQQPGSVYVPNASFNIAPTP